MVFAGFSAIRPRLVTKETSMSSYAPVQVCFV